MSVPGVSVAGDRLGAGFDFRDGPGVFGGLGNSRVGAFAGVDEFGLVVGVGGGGEGSLELEANGGW